MSQENDIPNCPFCNVNLIMRLNSKTRIAFWGCKNFPKCKWSECTEEELENSRDYPDFDLMDW